MMSNDSRSPDPMRGLSRRSLLKGGAALVALHASRLLSFSAAAASAKPRVAVVGAGAFGGWTALHLLRRGARVILLDAWGPGNSRASSGGETRVIRATYGADSPYTRMAAHALELWKHHEKRWKRQFLHRTGVLWMAASGEDSFERGSVEMLRKAGTKHKELSLRDLKKRWPQINFEEMTWAT